MTFSFMASSAPTRATGNTPPAKLEVLPGATQPQPAPSPSTWAANAWHHVQIAVHRDGSGNAYYDSVTFDGATKTVGESGFSSFPLNWNPNGDLLLNFQLDGLGSSGSITAYVDGLTQIWW